MSVQTAGSAQPRRIGWLIAERVLLAIWVTAALVTMYPNFGKSLHLYGGIFTSYAADLTNPPWLYIVLRRGSVFRLIRWFGSSPELAAGSIFVGGVLSEVSQIIWPKGFFAGTFDPLDIVAYGTGLLVCYVLERRELRSQTAVAQSQQRI
jgi:hypothetical protein